MTIIENPVLAMPVRPEGRLSFRQFSGLFVRIRLAPIRPRPSMMRSLLAVYCGAVGSSSTNQAVFGTCCSIMLQITGSPNLPAACLSLALAVVF
jgi:hypothetical protein